MNPLSLFGLNFRLWKQRRIALLVNNFHNSDDVVGSGTEAEFGENRFLVVDGCLLAENFQILLAQCTKWFCQNHNGLLLLSGRVHVIYTRCHTIRFTDGTNARRRTASWAHKMPSSLEIWDELQMRSSLELLDEFRETFGELDMSLLCGSSVVSRLESCPDKRVRLRMIFGKSQRYPSSFSY